MPPDALQRTAYCTNPGLQSFLLASPGVSTRDHSSERRNYLGEKRPVILTESCYFHAYTFGFFYMPQVRDMGQTALLPFRRIFSPWKIRRLRPGLNPRTWVPKAGTLTLDHRSRWISEFTEICVHASDNRCNVNLVVCKTYWMRGKHVFLALLANHLTLKWRTHQWMQHIRLLPIN